MKLPDRGEVSDQRGRGESRVTRSDLDEILGRLWIPARFSSRVQKYLDSG